MSPRRAGSESPIGSCQEKPLQSVLPALPSPDGFPSALPHGTGVIFQRGLAPGWARCCESSPVPLAANCSQKVPSAGHSTGLWGRRGVTDPAVGCSGMCRAVVPGPLSPGCPHCPVPCGHLGTGSDVPSPMGGTRWLSRVLLWWLQRQGWVLDVLGLKLQHSGSCPQGCPHGAALASAPLSFPYTCICSPFTYIFFPYVVDFLSFFFFLMF